MIAFPFSVGFSGRCTFFVGCANQLATSTKGITPPPPRVPIMATISMITLIDCPLCPCAGGSGIFGNFCMYNHFSSLNKYLGVHWLLYFVFFFGHWYSHQSRLLLYIAFQASLISDQLFFVPTHLPKRASVLCLFLKSCINRCISFSLLLYFEYSLCERPLFTCTPFFCPFILHLSHGALFTACLDICPSLLSEYICCCSSVQPSQIWSVIWAHASALQLCSWHNFIGTQISPSAISFLVVDLSVSLPDLTDLPLTA